MKFRNSMTQFLRSGPDFGLAALLDLSLQVSSDPQNMADTIEFGMVWIRDLIVLKMEGATSTIVNTDLIDILTTSAQHHAVSELLSIHQEMANTLELLSSDTNINRNLLADVMFLRIRDRISDKTGRSARPLMIKGQQNA